jgi:hypothetical protein
LCSHAHAVGGESEQLARIPSLSPQNETDNLTGKAQEEGSKVTENLRKYTSGVSARLEETKQSMTERTKSTMESVSSSWAKLKESMATKVCGEIRVVLQLHLFFV